MTNRFPTALQNAKNFFRRTPPAEGAFRRAVERLEIETEQTSRRAVTELGRQAPRCWRAIWSFTEALYEYATCASGCPGVERDHTLRYIAGRATNIALSAVHSATAGWYDNSLLACRALGEQANLVTLLVHSEEALAVYKSGDKRARMSRLGPRAVRTDLERLDVASIVSAERAELLSERVVHPSFDEIVLSHSPQRLVVGPIWQEAGFVLCLNELAIALGGYLYLTRDPQITTAEASALTAQAEALADGIGGLLIDDLPPGLAQPVPDHRWLQLPFA